ncbi:MAG: hypothetical protein U1E51_25915 [Candidatus Binatia bacterium]|nr:hypothetical protein [Candidatus Binatia bacterium]
MKAVSKSKIESALFDLKQTLEKLPAELADLHAASNGIANRPSTVAENVATFTAAINAIAKDGFQEWRHFVATPSPDQKTAADLLTPIFGNVTDDFRHIVGNLLAAFSDEFKKKLPTFFASLAEPNQISEEDRRLQLAEYATKIKLLEEQEEGIYSQLEQVGATVDRRADLSPAVFLESSNGGYDLEKLRRLSKCVHNLAIEDGELATSLNESNAKILALKKQMAEAENRRQVTRPETYKQTIEHITAALRKEELRVIDIKERRIPLDARRLAAIHLMNASKDFLREKGVSFED